MESITVSKLDTALRQLETAILLFFTRGDPVAIHTLTCAAYSIIDDVNRDPCGAPMFVLGVYLSTPGRPSANDIRAAQNFFKHADKDPSATLTFYPKQSLPMLADACNTYSRLTDTQPSLFEMLMRWYHCHGGRQQFDWPPEKDTLLSELLDLFAADDREGCFERCRQP